jgi:hypothetical protein
MRLLSFFALCAVFLFISGGCGAGAKKGPVIQMDRQAQPGKNTAGSGDKAANVGGGSPDVALDKNVSGPAGDKSPVKKVVPDAAEVTGGSPGPGGSGIGPGLGGPGVGPAAGGPGGSSVPGVPPGADFSNGAGF